MNKTNRIIPVEVLMDQFFGQFPDISEAISVMYNDIDDLGLNDKTINKLLRLASCPSAAIGEKLNAGRAAFKLIAKYVN